MVVLLHYDRATYCLFCFSRPLDIQLVVPESCRTAVNSVCEQIHSNLPSERELASLQSRARRLLSLIENILTQHELLAKEAIRTMRTIRRIAKCTTICISLLLVYFYVRKFHNQSRVYQFIADRRLVIAMILGTLSLATYCYSHKKLCLKTIALIS